jgi:16S rRNA (guanine1516-N2)-methyltransferase
VLITTSYDPRTDQLESAARLAEQIRGFDEISGPVRIVERKGLSLTRMREQYGDLNILLVSRERIEYYHHQQPVLFFHPSTAAIRVKRLIHGETDSLMELSGIKPGDRVLDCTAGLGSDAIVYSFAVQGNGKVTALEKQPIPYLMLSQGLGAYHSDISGMNEAMRRVQVVHAEHLHFLQQQTDKSYEVVYLDPMFRKPIHESSSISAIRQLADPNPLTEMVIKEARRVANRTIVLKEHRDSGEFARLGFEKVYRTTTKIAYGVIRL